MSAIKISHEWYEKWSAVLDAAVEFVDEVERCQGCHESAHDEYLSLLRAQEARMADEVKRVEGWEFVVTRKRSTGCAYERHSVDLDFDGLRALLRSQVLHIVGEAEMRVLRLMAEVNPRRLHEMHDGISNLGGACDAELARRAAKGE